MLPNQIVYRLSTRRSAQAIIFAWSSDRKSNKIFVSYDKNKVPARPLLPKHPRYYGQAQRQQTEPHRATGTERIRPICGVRAVRSIPAFARIPPGAGAGGAKWGKSNFVTFVVAGDGFSQTSYLIQKGWQPHWSLLLFEERLKLWALSNSLSLPFWLNHTMT